MHAELHDKATYWQAVRAQQIADGLTVDASRNTIKVGDRVQIKDREWERVVKVKAKTLDVHTPHMPWPMRYTSGEVTAHQPEPDEAAEAG
ncbi:hypothetical protein ACIRCZ_18555 [Leifsonia sp. NPDC102414]|uniref:hypothetical protein n=1 Tax=Leifsonia sp. NPDC102414 TaxID=3364124 RepID=UPI003825CD00